MLKGKIHSIETFGAVDGPGIRFVLFMQGCPLRCAYCHNPDTWDIADGTEMSVDEVISKILPYRLFYRGGGGVTLSGGEPLMQHEFAAALLSELKRYDIHTAIDTAASIPLETCIDAVDSADMLLLDIKSIDPEQAEHITGMHGILEREKSYLDYCEEHGKSVWIRHVVVPNLTLDRDKIARLADFLSGYTCVKRIDPLAFHKLGEHKWEPELYTLVDTPAPSKEDMEWVNALLAKK